MNLTLNLIDMTQTPSSQKKKNETKAAESTPELSLIEQEIMDRYKKAGKEIKDSFSDAAIRDFEFRAVLAKIEELDLPRTVLTELEYHYFRFQQHNPTTT